MDEPAAKNQPLSRLVSRAHNISKVTLIGWSWGAMMAGYYTSLHSEKRPETRPLCTALQFTRISGPAADCRINAGRAISTSRSAPIVFASEAANTARWNGEIPVDNKDEYPDPALPVEFWKECLATDPTSNTRTPRACAHPMAPSSCSRSSETYSSMRSPAF